MFNQNQSGDGTSSLVTVCALMANVIIVRSMWQYDVVHFGNPVTILAMPYKKLDLDKYIVLIISMTFRCHFPNCSVGNRTCWNTIIFSPCCMDDSMQQRRCIHWLYCGLRWQSSSESKYTGPDLCSYKWRLYRKDIWKVKANGFMIVHSPPARWGSLDFNEGATPSFPFLLPSLAITPVFFHCGVSAGHHIASDAMGHPWIRMKKCQTGCQNRCQTECHGGDHNSTHLRSGYSILMFASFCW